MLRGCEERRDVSIVEEKTTGASRKRAWTGRGGSHLRLSFTTASRSPLVSIVLHLMELSLRSVGSSESERGQNHAHSERKATLLMHALRRGGRKRTLDNVIVRGIERCRWILEWVEQSS